jgi:lycopene beta-cyclase
VRLDTRVKTINERNVFTMAGEELQAECIVDGRGLKPSDDLALGYQTFLGLEVRLERSHGQAHPIIMDATVDQLDGYRFVYTLPLTHDRILIEDTYYNDTTSFDEAAIERRISDYAASRGWTIAEVERREHGILPIVLAGHIEEFWNPVHASIPRTGLRAALFHPVTGYSLPDAVRLADLVSQQTSFTTANIAALIRDHAVGHWTDRAFYRLLNRMLFIAASPPERITVLQRFYRLPEPLIQRFYAGRTTLADQIRILVGKPPVSISRALSCLRPDAAWSFTQRQSHAPAAKQDTAV